MIVLLLSCGRPGVLPCEPERSYPYPPNMSFLGIHGDPGNSDVIACSSAESYEQQWVALEGLGMTQPNTFSPDGKVVYATTSNPEREGCRVHAMDARTGEAIWCHYEEPSVSLGAMEVDQEGRLYYTVEERIVSRDEDGELLWELVLPAEDGTPWGLHFTPDGHIATVTSEGMVYLVDRETGLGLSALSIPETWGYVAPAFLDLDIDLTALVPGQVAADIETVWGPVTDEDAQGGFSVLLGAGAFCDNTVGVDSQGRIYVIGGGEDPDHGAMVQIRVGGSAEAPVLEPGWSTPTNAGSATSPSISAGDRYVVISDGASSKTFLDPESVDAWVKVMDIEACDANTDADEDPTRCAVAYQHPVGRQPLIGAPAIAEDGTVWFWEMSLAWDADPDDPDVVSFGPEGLIYAAAMPDDLDWTSVMTVTDNHLIGTASAITPSEETLFGVNFPVRTDDSLVVLDRKTGEMVFSTPVLDDGASTVSIAPDGSLYVAVYGLFSMLSLEDRPDLGLVKFSPVTSEQRRP